MTRQELYQLIKEHNLEEKIKQFFNGKNYTNISTVDLETFVTKRIKKQEKILSGMTESQSNTYCNRMICNAIKNFCDRYPDKGFGEIVHILDIKNITKHDNSQKALWRVNASLNRYNKSHR